MLPSKYTLTKYQALASTDVDKFQVCPNSLSGKRRPKWKTEQNKYKSFAKQAFHSNMWCLRWPQILKTGWPILQWGREIGMKKCKAPLKTKPNAKPVSIWYRYHLPSRAKVSLVRPKRWEASPTSRGPIHLHLFPQSTCPLNSRARWTLTLSTPGRGKRKHRAAIWLLAPQVGVELREARKTKGAQLKHVIRNHSDFFS